MPNTVMAFDYGDARIGVALANDLLQIPHPLSTITGKVGMWPKIDACAALISKWQPKLLVVGIPEENPAYPAKVQLINTINNFAKRLGRKFNLPVCMVREDYSSASAKLMLDEQAVYGADQVGKLDQLAACAILQTYFAHYAD